MLALPHVLRYGKRAKKALRQGMERTQSLDCSGITEEITDFAKGVSNNGLANKMREGNNARNNMTVLRTPINRLPWDIGSLKR